MEEVSISTFYHFFPLEEKEVACLKAEMNKFCSKNNIKGTVILADEGINATVSGKKHSVDMFMQYLISNRQMKDLEWKESSYFKDPFEKLKIKVKKEAIRMGVKDLEIFDKSVRGEYVEAEDWDDFISQPDVVVIDTRNEYETRIGSFKNSVFPNTKTFRQFPDWFEGWSKGKVSEDTKVAMFCTGGVRCEKSTAYMKTLGFKNVYHLKGGVLKYFEETGNKNGMWEGECFIFDDRASVNASLKPSGKLLCTECENVVTADDLKHGPVGCIKCHDCIN